MIADDASGITICDMQVLWEKDRMDPDQEWKGYACRSRAGRIQGAGDRKKNSYAAHHMGRGCHPCGHVVTGSERDEKDGQGGSDAMIADGFYDLDCFDGFKKIDDGSIDMILCDLPYGTTQCSWDTVLPFEQLWKEYERIIKDDGAILLFGMEPFSSHLRMSNIEMYKYDWIWHKTSPRGHLNAKIQPMRAHENISVFYKKQPTYNPQMTHGHRRKVSKTRYTQDNDGRGCYGKEDRDTLYDSTDRYPIDVQTFSNGDQTDKIHPTQKPVRLLEYMILTYTNAGDLVLDNCAGSCSTGIAAHNVGRRFIGFEKDREIYTRANKRLLQHMSQLTLFDVWGSEVISDGRGLHT